ncbi:unnamed protein product [Miscanthus lutarioriparius]|uniref:KHDC4/BBP-like KH-domain type I domain-containing protein n=1 Tax=Miscanthus lutarioriparius TaxID=422564 RepID=A0A811PPC0_9POAL|nr:unnamed protein product [Miscanthus lutarioriparius]
MTTKLDHSSAEHRQAKSTAPSSLTPKISMFGAKAGFVIPKNKLAGSLVIRSTIAKNETPAASSEDSSRHVQRKTKWASDLALDPVVCKGRALAYQTRVEQITKQLKSGTLDTSEIDGSVSAGNDLNSIGSDILKENELGNVELLELERRELIGEILRLNPGYKTPENYKPVLKETKVPLPAEAHPGHNIIGVLLGPESSTQKRLHEETGAVIRVYGTKKINGEKSEIRHQDINEAQDAYEDLYINVSADSYDKVDAAVVLIELLLAPVSVKSTATSTTTAVPSAVTSKDAVSANVQLVQNTTSQPDLLHYQSHNPPWLPTPQTNAPSIPSTGPVLSTLPNNSLQPQPPAGSFSMPPYTGQPPHMNSMPRNPFPVPGPQQSTPSNQQHPPQFRANNSIGPSFGQPPGIVSPHMTPSSSMPPPVRSLQIPHPSCGWPPFSPVTPQSQRPLQASPYFMAMRPPISVSPVGATPTQGPIALTPSNMPTMYRSQHPPVPNFTGSAPLVSRPPGGAQSFPTAAPQGPSSVAFPGGASPQSPYPPTPDQMRGPPPAFSPVGSTPGMVPPSIASSGAPAPGPANTSGSQAQIAPLRPPLPVTGDFTFRPVISPVPTPDFAASNHQMGIQDRTHPGPFFHHSNQNPNQGFQRPFDGRSMNMMGQAQMHPPPPHFHGAFPRNPSPLEFTAGFRGVRPAVQAPQMPAPSNPSSFLPSRPFQLRPPPQQDMSGAGGNRPGGNQIYNPFAPTAAQRTEADPEYEDLMASVGVK